MAKFDFMVFDDDSFVANANVYTKEQVLELFNGSEKPFAYQKMLNAKTGRIATIDDVNESICKYVAKAPEGHDFKGGCYILHKAGRGSFKVWYIDTWSLKIR
jgi:hypothetical protein